MPHIYIYIYTDTYTGHSNSWLTMTYTLNIYTIHNNVKVSPTGTVKNIHFHTHTKKDPSVILECVFRRCFGSLYDIFLPWHILQHIFQTRYIIPSSLQVKMACFLYNLGKCRGYQLPDLVCKITKVQAGSCSLRLSGFGGIFNYHT